MVDELVFGRDLDGSADAQGDLKSVVLHDMKIQHVSSNFPVSLGARITGVDDTTFSSTGESFSMIVLPNSNSANERTLQSDDVSLGACLFLLICPLLYALQQSETFLTPFASCPVCSLRVRQEGMLLATSFSPLSRPFPSLFPQRFCAACCDACIDVRCFFALGLGNHFGRFVWIKTGNFCLSFGFPSGCSLCCCRQTV